MCDKCSVKTAVSGVKIRRLQVGRQARSGAARIKSVGENPKERIWIHRLGLLRPKFQIYRELLERFPSNAGQAAIVRPGGKVHLRLASKTADSSKMLKLRNYIKNKNVRSQIGTYLLSTRPDFETEDLNECHRCL